MERQLNILLVEDDELDVVMFERTLRAVSPNATMTHAADGVAALDVIRSDQVPKPFIVVADVNMPRMDGHELAVYLRQESSCANNMMFMLTTSDSPQDIKAAYSAGVNGYIVKPNSREGISSIIRCIQDYWSTCEPPLSAA
jgi:CheY-like chemotaxis protein